jgi:ribonuclease T2
VSERGILNHMRGLRYLSTAFIVTLTSLTPLRAQNKAEPGRFDFYLLDMPWGPEFCSIADVSPQCKPQQSFLVHGLWPQNNDGSYPVFCSEEPGSLNPRENLDLTPDLHLLAHEWDKHGTCSAQGPQHFFQMEREAFTSINVPLAFDHIEHETTMSPKQILDLFYKANPQLPEASLIVSCREDHFTAVEACFTRSLKPMPCLGLHSCTRPSLKLAPVPAKK